MSGAQYFKLASSNLRRGAESIQKDIDSIRDNFLRHDKEVRKQIDDIVKQINRNNLLMASPKFSDMYRADKLRENTELQGKVNDIKHDLAKHKEQTDQQVNDLQRMMNDLKGKAGELENLAASQR